MTAIRYSQSAVRDLQRLAEFLRQHDGEGAARTATLIARAIRILAEHPLIGRPVAVNRRELFIFRGRTGYLVQYAYSLTRDEVIILAVRHQREVEP
ncbi:MAG TPA: type II toxin-antitoxin system RelE/ParE family toxin [Usitatibacter sp.]|nr:type II toxin-antitoxin system RelE/ParE family toxin [Usitatibacter sp.]